MKEIIPTLNSYMNESVLEDRFKHYRSLGLQVDNVPTKGIIDRIKSTPERKYVDLSGKFVEGDFLLMYDSTYNSIYTFSLIDIKTKLPTGEKVDVQRGNLTHLRMVFNV